MTGVQLTPWLIRYAYERGAFPMTTEDNRVDWFQPRNRALFSMEGMDISRSLRRIIRKGVFEIRFDTCFEDIMRGCLRPDDNWISEDFIRVYTQIHHEGWAHCAEAWHDGELVGGVYGLAVGSCFCAESMFHRHSNASKVALWALIEKCRELGFTLFDAQIMNPHLRSLGAVEVTHAQYMRLLEDALTRSTPWSQHRYELQKPDANPATLQG
ncbi:MAG TPA: leucyl/phenylalanyl-tRNA--protein transferase [Fimbriimonadaceae bacterium]|nr:leucyl/phenylalanyl-tRNA--protein transferase [Fimbriimonadaceae bacterium]